jgi:hypothetical protein
MAVIVVSGGSPVPAPNYEGQKSINEILQKLSFGPLSNLSIGQDGGGYCDPTKIPALVGYINDGLTKLHGKFVLNERNLILEQHELITHYKLSKLYARTTGQGGDVNRVLFIKDSSLDPFLDDVIKVLQIFDDAGREIILNDQTVYGSIFTPRPDTLQIPIPVHGQPLYIQYQARHVPVLSTALDAKIDIPDVLFEALIAYTAYKVFFHMNGQEHSAKAQEHLGLYDRIVHEVEENDLVNSSISLNFNPKFHERGFR